MKVEQLVKISLLLVIVFAASSCSRVKLPSVSESKQKIEQYSRTYDSLNKIITKSEEYKRLRELSGNDILVKTDIAFINKLSTALAKQRNDDMTLVFHKTRNFITEDKSVLGIKYTNTVNIDTGQIKLNIKQLKFDITKSNRIGADIEIEGQGYLNVSGKYTGIPVSAKPEIKVYVKEAIEFKLSTSKTKSFSIEAVKHKVPMKTTFYLNLLDWKIPYNKDIMLDVQDVFPPFELPLTVLSSLTLPMPAQNFGSDFIEFRQFEIELIQPVMKSFNNKLIYKANVKFTGK